MKLSLKQYPATHSAEFKGTNVGEERATAISGAGTGYGRTLFHADVGELGELGETNDNIIAAIS